VKGSPQGDPFSWEHLNYTLPDQQQERHDNSSLKSIDHSLFLTGPGNLLIQENTAVT
jgi:hypothetical protein